VVTTTRASEAGQLGKAGLAWLRSALLVLMVWNG